MEFEEDIDVEAKAFCGKCGLKLGTVKRQESKNIVMDAGNGNSGFF